MTRQEKHTISTDPQQRTIRLPLIECTTLDKDQTGSGVLLLFLGNLKSTHFGIVVIPTGNGGLIWLFLTGSKKGYGEGQDY